MSVKILKKILFMFVVLNMSSAFASRILPVDVEVEGKGATPCGYCNDTSPDLLRDGISDINEVNTIIYESQGSGNGVDPNGITGPTGVAV